MTARDAIFSLISLSPHWRLSCPSARDLLSTTYLMSRDRTRNLDRILAVVVRLTGAVCGVVVAGLTGAVCGLVVVGLTGAVSRWHGTNDGTNADCFEIQCFQCFETTPKYPILFPISI